MHGCVQVVLKHLQMCAHQHRCAGTRGSCLSVSCPTSSSLQINSSRENLSLSNEGPWEPSTHSMSARTNRGLQRFSVMHVLHQGLRVIGSARCILSQNAAGLCRRCCSSACRIQRKLHRPSSQQLTIRLFMIWLPALQHLLEQGLRSETLSHLFFHFG